MSVIMLDITGDLADALVRQSLASQMSVQALGAAVLEQWVLDQASDKQEPWLPEDIAAIDDGLAQAKAGQTISHTEASARIFAIVK